MSPRALLLFAAVGLPAALAAPAASAGFLAQCTNVRVTDGWLAADCPGKTGSVNSAVYLNSFLENSDGNLKWKYEGSYSTYCSECVLDGAILTCNCRKATGYWGTASINLEERIANYDGHLLSDVNGKPTIPQDSGVPVPADFKYDIGLGPATGCDGTPIQQANPYRCWDFQYGSWIYEWQSTGFRKENKAWAVTLFADQKCNGGNLGTLTPENGTTCARLPGTAKAAYIAPLFNAQW